MIECKYCGKNYQSYKSWHRHKSTVHKDMIGDARVKAKYEQSPLLCQECSTPIPFTKRQNKFCNSACAAKHSNRLRDQEEVARKRKETWLANRPGYVPSPGYVNVPIIAECVTCSTKFVKRNAQKYCHPTCSTGKLGKVNYRSLCRFKISPVKHPQLYNFDLVKEFGWYRPANHPDGYNPDGVTWDHLFRIEDGYQQKVDPSIMSHPANAEMLSWRVNQKRKQSQITLAELLLRIEDWVD